MRGSHGAGPQLADKTLINPIRNAPGLPPDYLSVLNRVCIQALSFQHLEHGEFDFFYQKFQESEIKVGDPLLCLSVCQQQVI